MRLGLTYAFPSDVCRGTRTKTCKDNKHFEPCATHKIFKQKDQGCPSCKGERKSDNKNNSNNNKTKKKKGNQHGSPKKKYGKGN